ncbi:MAG: metallophosphoesterase [Bacilli bacterium]|nr:metallophosphoesterase [Bacilli bacterium]
MKIKDLNLKFVEQIKKRKFNGRVIESVVYTRKLNFGQQIKTLTISDMHGYTNRDGRTEKLIDAIREQKPDVIFIPGDVFSGGKVWEGGNKLEKFKKFVANISKIAPVVLTWGNHDLRGMNDSNGKIRLDNFHELSTLNPGRVFPLYNEKILLPNMEIVGVVPELLTMEFAGMADQINGRARDYVINTYDEKIDVDIEHKPGMLTVALLHNPHLVTTSAKGTTLGKLVAVDLFISGHLHDGYFALFNTFNKIKKALTGKGFKVFEYDCGLVEQVYGLNDKDDNKIKGFRILGKTNRCRGNIYIDDYSQAKILEVYGEFYRNIATEINEEEWEPISKKEAVKEYIEKEYHCTLISEGLYPNFFLPIHTGKMDTINVVIYRRVPDDSDDYGDSHTRTR